eukprot:IDg20843t1
MSTARVNTAADAVSGVNTHARRSYQNRRVPPPRTDNSGCPAVTRAPVRAHVVPAARAPHGAAHARTARRAGGGGESRGGAETMQPPACHLTTPRREPETFAAIMAAPGAHGAAQRGVARAFAARAGSRRAERRALHGARYEAQADAQRSGAITAIAWECVRLARTSGNT